MAFFITSKIQYTLKLVLMPNKLNLQIHYI